MNVVPSDQRCLDAIMCREFSGTARNARFASLRLYNPFCHGVRAPVHDATLKGYLTTAGRSNEAAWVAAHYEGLRKSDGCGVPNIDYTMFVKDECYPGKNPEDVKPRLIKKCGDAYAAAFNPICHAIGGHWKANQRQDRMACMGFTRDDVGDWVDWAIGQFTNPAFVENDCSAWDTSVSRDAL